MINIFRVKLAVVFSAVAFAFYFFFSKPIMVQPQDYHQFVDQRHFLGIPNFLDVFSNVFFLLVGAAGVLEIMRRHTHLLSQRSWYWFFLSILLIAPGSAYYHWGPNDSSLIWDRLPMSMGFMALYISLLSEHFSEKFEKFLPLALLVGISSVLVWVVTSDLRLYFVVQFSSFITIPIILVLFRSAFTLKYWYYLALLIYGLAKWAEVKDVEVFRLTQELVSGHTLKHILAALGLYCLLIMIRKRKPRLIEAPAARTVVDTSST